MCTSHYGLVFYIPKRGLKIAVFEAETYKQLRVPGTNLDSKILPLTVILLSERKKALLSGGDKPEQASDMRHAVVRS